MNNAMMGDVVVCADADAVAEELADRIVVAARSAVADRGRFVLALAGGSSPRAAYEMLAAIPRRDMIDWSKTICLFGDERCVAPDDKESNFRMATETLLSRVGIPNKNVLRMRGELEPPAAAAAYAHELIQACGPEPVIDLVLLGLGPDAHTASWFPDVVLNEEALVDAPYVPKFGSSRLTLTPRVVNAARAIVVAACGEQKADAAAAVFGPERDTLHIPAQRLGPLAGSLSWLLDEAAAGGLRAIS